MITPENIKELRHQTSVSIMVCKKALEEAGGDMEKALLILRKEGAKIADKKSSRALKSGIVESYMHSSGRVGVMVDVRCETDFVAKNEDFKEFAHNVAMHIAALDPAYVSKDDISADAREGIEKVFSEEMEKVDKPEEIKKQILEGKINAYFKEKTLLEQSYVKRQDITIDEYLKEVIQKFGENTEIARFVRFSI